MANYFFPIVIGIGIFLLSIETSISGVTDFLVEQTTSFVGIALFFCICCSFVTLSVVLFRYIKNKTSDILSASKQLRILYRIVVLVQTIAIGVMIAILLEIILMSQYHTILLFIVVTIVPITSAIVMLISFLVIFSWYRSNKNAYVLLIFGAAFLVTAYTFAFTAFSDVSILFTKDWIITPQSEVVFVSDDYQSGSALKLMSDIYEYTATGSFLLFIAGSAIMLHHYSRNLGAAKFWTIVLLPSVYFLSTLIDTLGIYVPETDTELFNYYLYYSLNGIIVGLMLGFSFWVVSRTVKANKSVATYLMLSSYGYIFLSLSGSSNVSTASYPPFGFASYAMLPLSSFMVILGLYSTAISISQDIRLRQYIKELTRTDSSFLSIASQAQVERRVQDKASDLENVVKEQRMELEKKSGIQSSIQEQDIKQYLLEVLQEVDKHKSLS